VEITLLSVEARMFEILKPGGVERSYAWTHAMTEASSRVSVPVGYC
jgi:hypothetical protein